MSNSQPTPPFTVKKRRSLDIGSPSSSTGRHPMGSFASSPVSRSPIQGTILLGRYRINSQLAQGGMSTVYLARNFEEGGLFAVKVIRADLVRDLTIRERIFNELKAVQRIDHPAVVKIFDLGKIGDDQICLVMEYIHGTPLRRIVQGTPVKLSRVISIIGAIAEGLRAAHAQQVIHRDLKPENVLLPRGDNCPSLVKLIDFGIARILDTPRITTTQHVMGTPEYISPEQALGSKIDHRADIYSLGVMMYEMLVGSLPFRDADPDALLHHHIHTPPPALPNRVTTGDEIPKSIQDVVMACLSKDPCNRPSDIGIVLEVLSNC